MLADPELRRCVGSAWALYLMLVLDWGGTATGTRDEIGEKLGEDGRNVGNWIIGLQDAGIVMVERTGRRLNIILKGAHMDVAQMPDAVTVVKDTETPHPVLDARRRGILELIDKAKALDGEAEVRITVRSR